MPPPNPAHIILLLAISLAGLLHATPEAQANNTIADLQSHLASAPSKDKTLWQYRLAATALRKSENTIAKTSLDAALAQATENYGKPNADAAKSRLFTKRESDKPFIGEPYERSLANYYRALLYWKEGDLENARALLRTAQLLDSDTVNKTYAGDYILFDYLEGLAESKLGNPVAAAESLARARASAAAQERATPPDYAPDANVLIFAEYSAGPEKFRTGKSNEVLAYSIPTHVCTLAKLKIGERIIELPPYDDTGFQALTRGGRLMDQITTRKGKLGRKGLLAGLLLGEPLLTFTSYTITQNAKADTRCWNNLPRYLSFAAIKLPPGTHEAELEYYDSLGRLYTAQVRHLTITVSEKSDTIIFSSMLLK